MNIFFIISIIGNVLLLANLHYTTIKGKKIRWAFEHQNYLIATIDKFIKIAIKNKMKIITNYSYDEVYKRILGDFEKWIKFNYNFNFESFIQDKELWKIIKLTVYKTENMKEIYKMKEEENG
jgi:hypothetical protein